jgi:hypothetical protein
LDKKLGVTIFYPLDKELCFATDQDKFCIFWRNAVVCTIDIWLLNKNS